MDPDSQTSIDEREIQNPDLESLLSDREVAKGAAGEARKKYKTVDDLAKEKIAELGLDDGDVVRIGRFRVRQVAVASREVAFETEPTSRLTIGVVDED